MPALTHGVPKKTFYVPACCFLLVLLVVVVLLLKYVTHPGP